MIGNGNVGPRWSHSSVRRCAVIFSSLHRKRGWTPLLFSLDMIWRDHLVLPYLLKVKEVWSAILLCPWTNKKNCWHPKGGCQSTSSSDSVVAMTMILLGAFSMHCVNLSCVMRWNHASWLWNYLAWQRLTYKSSGGWVVKAGGTGCTTITDSNNILYCDLVIQIFVNSFNFLQLPVYTERPSAQHFILITSD